MNATMLTHVCKANDRVILYFLQQVPGLARPRTAGSRENVGHNVPRHVQGGERRNTNSQSVKAGAIELNWNQIADLETKSKTPPEPGRRTHLFHLTYFYSYSVICPLLYFYFNIASDVVTVWLIFDHHCHFHYTLKTKIPTNLLDSFL